MLMGFASGTGGTITGWPNYTTITVGLDGGKRCDLVTFAHDGAFAAAETRPVEILPERASDRLVPKVERKSLEQN